MHSYINKAQEERNSSRTSSSAQKASSGESTFQFIDNRTESMEQRELQAEADDSLMVHEAAQLQSIANNHVTEQQAPVQKQANTTGLPDDMKAGIENLSGYSMDDVNVHYNSDKPEKLDAHAYAQGTNIHIAPGQEQHLAHEAWHVVQQKQGRVSPTRSQSGIQINDNSQLEKEADVMGGKASSAQVSQEPLQAKTISSQTYQLFPKEKLLVVLKKVEELLGGIPYQVIGSAAAAYHGADVDPSDIDIVFRSPDDYKKVKRLFPKEVEAQGSKTESAVEVLIDEVNVEFLSPEISRAIEGGGRGVDHNVINKEEILTRASTRFKGVRLKEVVIISSMLEQIDFTGMSSRSKRGILGKINSAIQSFTEVLSRDKQKKFEQEGIKEVSSIDAAKVVFEKIKKVSTESEGGLTEADKAAIGRMSGIEDEYGDDVLDEDGVIAEMNKLYIGLSKLGLSEVYELGMGILGDDAPAPPGK